MTVNIQSSFDSNPAKAEGTINQLAEAMVNTETTQAWYTANVDAAIAQLNVADLSNGVAYAVVFGYCDLGQTPAYKSVDGYKDMTEMLCAKYPMIVRQRIGQPVSATGYHRLAAGTGAQGEWALGTVRAGYADSPRCWSGVRSPETLP